MGFEPWFYVKASLLEIEGTNPPQILKSILLLIFLAMITFQPGAWHIKLRKDMDCRMDGEMARWHYLVVVVFFLLFKFRVIGRSTLGRAP